MRNARVNKKLNRHGLPILDGESSKGKPCKKCGEPVRMARKGYHWMAQGMDGKAHRCKG